MERPKCSSLLLVAPKFQLGHFFAEMERSSNTLPSTAIIQVSIGPLLCRNGKGSMSLRYTQASEVSIGPLLCRNGKCQSAVLHMSMTPVSIGPLLCRNGKLFCPLQRGLLVLRFNWATSLQKWKGRGQNKRSRVAGFQLGHFFAEMESSSMIR